MLLKPSSYIVKQKTAAKSNNSYYAVQPDLEFIHHIQYKGPEIRISAEIVLSGRTLPTHKGRAIISTSLREAKSIEKKPVVICKRCGADGTKCIKEYKSPIDGAKLEAQHACQCQQSIEGCRSWQKIFFSGRERVNTEKYNYWLFTGARIKVRLFTTGDR